MNKQPKLFYFIALLCCINLTINASEIEVGAGIITTSIPDYIGSSEQKSYLLPFPYFYYKNESLEIDRNALTGFLWHKKNWYLDFSFSGSIPVKSHSNNARRGMRDLDWVGELGPALNYFLVGDPNSHQQVNLAFKSRKAVATNFSSMTDVGWIFGPSIHYQKLFPTFGYGELQLETELNINFANQKYLNYYYGVSVDEQGENRNFFSASRGYQGSNLNVGFTWKKNHWWVGSFIKFHALYGTKQQSSPLVENNNSWYIGAGFAWIFYKNK